ncbi:MAG: sugar phosphate isomerase/epimerase [Phycisphaerales bacterium]|jgi:sugar phosphate isomerase/epimerase|nr:sugar phosphate isomerase/epimerase [Phycisphaerales bacterium]
MALTEVPRFVRDELGLAGLLLTTDVLVGADRARLNQILEAADKAGCPVLGLSQSEPLDLATEDELRGEAAVERCMRVAQAAHWMGCSAFSIPVLAPDNEDALETVADRLKGVARRSEKLDLNLAIAPMPGPGLTATAERVSELLKKIGGFRIGTLPDFATAATSGDPVAYLRRLVPYATLVVASGVKFESAVKIVKSDGGGAGGAGEGGAGAGGRGKGKKKVEAAPAPAGDEDRLSSAATPAERAAELVHSGYDLAQLGSVLVAVGFEGSIALDYRGNDDPLAPILAIKNVLERLFSTGVDDAILEGLDDLPELPDDEEEKA